MKTDAEIYGPETWEKELREAGWNEVRRNVWRRPDDGALFRGPYGAWCALLGDAEATRRDLRAAERVAP